MKVRGEMATRARECVEELHDSSEGRGKRITVVTTRCTNLRGRSEW
jgi:hypothetical protein